MIRGRELLTKEQREKFMEFPDEYNMDAYYIFSKADINLIKKHRKEENQLGFAIQLAALRYPGWPYMLNKNVPEFMIKYIAKQLQVSPYALKIYSSRETTSREHIKEIKQNYGYTIFSDHNYYDKVLKYLINIAFENDDVIFLIRECISFFKENKIILPAITTIEALVWESKQKSESIVIDKIVCFLTDEQRLKLDEIIFLSSDKIKTKTILGWLKEPIGRPSSDNFLKVIEKLEYIRNLNLTSLKLDKLHAIKVNQIYNLGQKYEPYSFREFHKDKRHAILAIFLLNLSKDLTDKAFEIHDRIIQTVMSSGRKAQEEIQKQNGKKINEKVIEFTSIGDALIYAKENKLNPIELIETSIGWSTFVNSIEEAKALARPINYDYLDLIEKKYTTLRRYTPSLLESLTFKSFKKNEPILESIEVLRTLNITGKRKVPQESPINFMSKRWKHHVIEKDGSINRRYYELAVLSEIRDRVKAGDISIDGSKQYKDFEEYLISKQEWNNLKVSTTLNVNSSFKEYITERYFLLDEKLKWLSKNLKTLDSISIENGKLSLNRLDKNTPKQAKELSISLYKTIPKIGLSDLLLDIAKITGFHKEFIHISTNKKPTNEEKNLIMAALLGMGTNIGLSKMADATPNITYKQLSLVSDWRMTEDAMKRAQDILVNYHHKLKLTQYWGDGTTSSSDGMRMKIGVASLHADFNPHYGNQKGATIYRFASDQFSSYYTKIIHTNSRDATHVLDGLLNNNSDLNIQEHYTDTAGYTDQVFALTHLLGFKFAPRIRDISDIKLFAMKDTIIYSNLENLLKGKINEKIIQENYDEVLRLAHSIKIGKVTSSLILSKLGSYARQNALATALREIGRIEKTIFILDYITSEELRRKIHRGLNKGEAMNGLARAIFFGKQGELRERTIQSQLQRATALNLIINAISIWNTIYLEKSINYKNSIGENIDESLLKHISPLSWSHINMLGEYTFNFDEDSNTNIIRPLNI